MLKVEKRKILKNHFNQIKVGQYGSLQEKEECSELKKLQEEVNQCITDVKFLTIEEVQDEVEN